MMALEKFGADKIATGHYANVVFDKNTKRYAIAKSKYVEKDQSYILYNLTQEQLSRLILPLSNFTKCEVRKKAAEAGIVLSQKRDSFDICFIKDGDYKKFIEIEKLGPDYKEKLASGAPKISFLERGHFIDKENTVLGWHDGIINYTVGQRRGIAIDVGEINKKSNLKFEGRAFVGEIDANNNTVTLVNDEDLFKDELSCKDVNFQACPDIKEPIKALCKIRYKDEGVYGILSKEENGIYKFKFDKKVRAIARGQSAVFYIDNKILCGGIIQ
jgi:tRNA-specific 2-thiouridylase